MIILSQDGTILLFQNHVRDIRVYNANVYIINYDNEMICLGKYDNEDRAIEILKQIATAILRRQDIFYMPEE